MRMLLSNMVMVLMAALLLPTLTGELVPAKNRWAIDEDIAGGFCELTYNQIEAGEYGCD